MAQTHREWAIEKRAGEISIGRIRSKRDGRKTAAAAAAAVKLMVIWGLQFLHLPL